MLIEQRHNLTFYRHKYRNNCSNSINSDNEVFKEGDFADFIAPIIKTAECKS